MRARACSAGCARVARVRLSPLLSHTHSPRALVLCCACGLTRRQLAAQRQGARAREGARLIGYPQRAFAVMQLKTPGWRGAHAPHHVARPVGMALDNDPGAPFGGVRASVFRPPLQRLLSEFHRHAHSRLAVPANQLLLRTQTRRGHAAGQPVPHTRRGAGAAPCIAHLVAVSAHSRTDVDTVTDIFQRPNVPRTNKHVPC